VEQTRFDPAALGLAPATIADLRGGEVADNRRIADQVLGGAHGPARDVVLLGAAAAIDSGAAGNALARWVVVSQKLGADPGT
jgi:anthranilate phosphoribosyltransferase